MKREISKITFVLCVLSLLAGCMGGRKINYSPQVYQNLSYLQHLSTEMANAAAVELPKFAPGAPEAVQQRPALLLAITRGAVQEVQDSVGGFYLVDSRQYEAVFQGGAGRGERALEPVEKAQLDPLVELVITTQKYQENTVSFYERELAQVASPVIVDGKVAAVAWIRFRLPSSLSSVTEEPKFNGTATRKGVEQ